MNRKILAEIIDTLEEREIVAAHLGYFSAAVVTDGPGGRRCGLATTLRGGPCAGPVPAAGSLAGKPAREIARLALNGGGPGASLGMAAINSALPPADCEEINAETLLTEQAAGKRVAVIGHFPFTDRLRAAAREAWVFELEPKDSRDLPPERMAELLPRADAVALTALTLLNGTFGEIMKLCRPGAFKLVLGPSAPLSAVLFRYGVDAVGGTRVADIPALLKALGEGANFRGLPGKKMIVLRKK